MFLHRDRSLWTWCGGVETHRLHVFLHRDRSLWTWCGGVETHRLHVFLHRDRSLWTWCGGVGNTQTACVLAQGQEPMDLVWRCRNDRLHVFLHKDRSMDGSGVCKQSTSLLIHGSILYLTSPWKVSTTSIFLISLCVCVCVCMYVCVCVCMCVCVCTESQKVFMIGFHV